MMDGCLPLHIKEQSSADYADFADLFCEKKPAPSRSKVNLRNRRNLRM
jgi:hypothetical protein